MGVVYLRLPEPLHEQLAALAGRRRESVTSLVKQMIAGNVGRVAQPLEESLDGLDEERENVVRVAISLTPSEAEEIDRRCGPTGRQRGPWIARVVREALKGGRQHFSLEEVAALERISFRLDELLESMTRFDLVERGAGRVPLMSTDVAAAIRAEVLTFTGEVRAMLGSAQGREPSR